MQDLTIQILKKTVEKLDSLGVDAHELRNDVLTLELLRRIDKDRAATPQRTPIDWAKLMPLILILAILVAAIIAALNEVRITELLT